jgi:hypothetical protein
MKTLKFLSIFLLFLTLSFSLQGQDNSVVPQRTPEQEAAKQTEKLQQELNLTSEQVRQVYEINLRYARERQISNTRSEAVERMKNKNSDIQRVLTAEQNERLQTKRYERTTIDAQMVNRTQQVVQPAGFRTPGEYRSNPTTVRVPSGDMNMRSTYRQSAPSAQSPAQQPQAVRRTTQPSSTQQSTSAPQTAPAVRSTQPSQTSTRSMPSSSTPATRRPEPSSGSPRR